MKQLLPIIPIVILTIIVALFPNLFSIALIPITLCGVLTISQIVKTTKDDNWTINVYFYTWIFVLISTYIAPLIHIVRNYWVPYMLTKPNDWSPYAFVTSTMYLVGILIWMAIFNKEKSLTIKRSSKKWSLAGNWQLWIFLFLLISLLAQLYVYSKVGGIAGYIHAYSLKSEGMNAFAGMGMFFILSESFPYTFLLYLIFKLKNRKVSKVGFYLILILLFVVTMFFGGLRGSRSNTVLFMVISAIAINIYIYRIKKSDIVMLLLCFFAFMYVGRMYKDYGENMLQETSPIVQTNSTLTSPETTIVGDLARYDVNSYQLFLLEEIRPDYSLKYGETYLWGFLTYIPGGSKIIQTFGLKGRSPAASELFYGSSEYDNSRILGPIGEWMINFGRFTFFIAYIIIGLLIRYIRRYTLSISVDDVRFMLIPSLIVFLPQLILSDFSNIMFFFVKRVVVVLIILFLISTKTYKTA